MTAKQIVRLLLYLDENPVKPSNFKQKNPALTGF